MPRLGVLQPAISGTVVEDAKGDIETVDMGESGASVGWLVIMQSVEETVLAGGVANQGSVVRAGDTVRRPRGPHSDAVAELLRHLERAGFEGVPLYLGTGDRGREVLSWIPGDVPLPPFPAWAMSDEALISVARLLRGYHDAVDGFVATHPGFMWSTELADPTGGWVLCHDDLCPENVVFREGRAVALLDFDYAGPGRRVWDVVATAAMWAPLVVPDWRKTHPPGLDGVSRTALFADSYGLDKTDRRAFFEVLTQRRAVGRNFVARHVKAGETSFIDMVDEFGGPEKWAATDRWLDEEQLHLTAALVDSHRTAEAT
jgi:hypothetical protein